ncbi:MAG: HNH endonuclease [Patescibacteria group bacterium]
MIIQFCKDCNKRLNKKVISNYCRKCRWNHFVPHNKLPAILCKCGNKVSTRKTKQCIKCRIAPSIKFCKGCNKRLNRAIRNWCKRCYLKELSSRKQYGSFNPIWKGGITMHSDGYIYIKDRSHPFSDKQGYVLEHRIVMEKHIGRYLSKNEIIHHMNEVKNDNRIENLRIMTLSEHTILHNKS